MSDRETWHPTIEEINWVKYNVLNYQDDTQTSHYSFTVRLMDRGGIRWYLNIYKELGYLSFIENKGIFNSRFTLYGKNSSQASALFTAYDDLETWRLKRQRQEDRFYEKAEL